MMDRRLADGIGPPHRSAIRDKTSEPEPGPQDQHRVEIELRVERALYVLCPTETVLLTVKEKIADRNPAFL
jgi:hypothetical protein